MADRNKPHTSRKKKFVFQEKCAPFPIPISSITHKPCGRSNWHHYTGTLHGEHVTISHTGDISYLNDMVQYAFSQDQHYIFCISYTGRSVSSAVDKHIGSNPVLGTHFSKPSDMVGIFDVTLLLIFVY